VVLFLFGFFSRRANATGARATLVLGSLSGIGLFVAVELLNLVQLHFLYVAPILFLVSSLVMLAASRLSAAPEPGRLDGYVWTRADYRRDSAALADSPWWANYRLHSLLLLLMTAAVVVAFW
jgi:SSS family solute:Na+ symporter